MICDVRGPPWLPCLSCQWYFAVGWLLSARHIEWWAGDNVATISTNDDDDDESREEDCKKNDKVRTSQEMDQQNKLQNSLAGGLDNWTALWREVWSISILLSAAPVCVLWWLWWLDDIQWHPVTSCQVSWTFVIPCHETVDMSQTPPSTNITCIIQQLSVMGTDSNLQQVSRLTLAMRYKENTISRNI